MIQRFRGQQIKPTVSPRGAPADAEVTLSMAGLTPLQSVRIGFGSFGQNEVIGRADADPLGNLSMMLRVPSWAERDRVHFFFLNLGNQVPRVLSDPFHVTGPDGIARLAGTISDKTNECLALDGPDRTLYALEGDVGTWSPGEPVLVVGTVADKAACGEGLPISVREIRRA